MQVHVYTPAPSPHIVGLLDALARREDLRLTVVYLRQRFDERQWESTPGRAPHRFLVAEGERPTWLRVGALAYRAARQESPDVAIVATSYFDLATHALILGFHHRGVPVVYFNEPPSVISPQPVKLIRRFLLRNLFRRISGLVGVTKRTVGEYRKAGYSGPATWAPYHRDLSPFLSVPLATHAPKILRFVVLGALIKRKDPGLALEAFACVANRAELHFVGQGPLEQTLKVRSERLGFRSVYFRGAASYDTVPGVLAEMSVLVMPSRNDGFGMAIMEALAAGLPVLASDATRAAVEYVRDGDNGWVFPVGHTDELARHMRLFVDAKQDWPSYSAAARRTVLDKYDADTDAERVAGFLRRVLEREVV